MRHLAAAGAWSHRGALVGTAITLFLAAALLSVSGVLVHSGLAAGEDGALLTALASSFGGTVLVVVLLVVTSAVSLALRGRHRDFALLRAVGATRGQVRRLVAVEVLLVVLVAAPAGALLGLVGSRVLVPLLRTGGVLEAGAGLVLGPVPVVAAVLLLALMGWVAGALGTREVLRARPSAAVRESTVEPRVLGRGRKVAAAVLTAVGLATSAGSLAVPGTVGSAGAGTSAFLLVGAAALAGPALVAWVLGRIPLPRSAAARLALLNSRGFSRRMTLAVVPLALVLTAGTAQSTTDRTITQAAQIQLTDGLRGALVVPAPADPAALRRLPGVVEAASSSSLPASVRTEEEDVPGLGALSWQPASVRVLDGLVDPGVVDGSLAGLSDPRAVAISQDAALEVGGVGSDVTIRFGSSEVVSTVAAVYERGLGLGDYAVGPAAARAAGTTPERDAVLLRTTPGRQSAVVAATGALTPAQYAERASAPDGERQLSLALLLAVLGFVVLAAANVLVMTTARRRDEMSLWHRTGATRRQLLAMVMLESGLTALTAWLIGTLAVLPAVLGVSYGLLGATVPAVDLVTYGALSGVVLAVPLLTMVPAAGWALRRPRVTD